MSDATTSHNDDGAPQTEPKSDSQESATKKPGGRGLESLLFLFGAVCLLGFGYQAYRSLTFKPHPRSGATGKVLAKLEEADHIPVEHGAAKGFNVIVISMDTTRADHLQCYGNTAIRTPVLNAMAQKGVLFASAFTASPSTLPGHSSIFTGLYPYHHGARANGTFRLESPQTTLAEILKQQGYNTCAAISAYVLDSRFGIGQGFDEFNDDLSKGVRWAPHMFRERPAEYTNDVIFKWLDEHAPKPAAKDPGSPFFVWVHYFDAHAPYMPAEPFRSRYASHLYDGEIAYVDKNIGKLLAKLEDLGVRDNTLIVVAGDHGEGLGEHGEQTHSLLTYDATLHTPLIFHSPKLMPSGHVVRKVVSNVDIVPTILDLLGVESSLKFDGVSLAKDSQDWPNGIYFETISTLTMHGWAPLFGIRNNNFKYIHAPTPEIYDIKKDPKESVNLFTEKPEEAVALSKELNEHVGDDPFMKNAPVQLADMAPDVKKNLAALGYVGSNSGDVLDVAAAAQLDPKEMVPLWENVSHANNLIATGKIREGVKILEEYVKEVPDNIYARGCLGQAYLSMSRIDDAEKTFLHMLEIGKKKVGAKVDPGHLVTLGRIYLRKHEFDKAKKQIDLALKMDPNLAGAISALGALAAAQGDREKAEAYYRKAIEMDPGSTGPAVYVELGNMFLSSLERDKAREAFTKAIELDKLNGAAHNGLGGILLDENKLDEAMDEFEIAVRYLPNHPSLLSSLAMLYDKQHKADKAKEFIDRALDVNPTFLPALNNQGLILKHAGDLDKAMDSFNKALEVSPAFLPARLNLALCYAARRDDEKATAEFMNVLRFNPNVPQALANVATYHGNHGRPAMAKRLLEQALRVAPGYALAHANYGTLLLQEGNRKGALIHFKRSLELDPDQAGKEDLEYRVEQLERTVKATGASPATTQPGTGTR